MKLIQANPKLNNKKSILSVLKTKERSIRDKGTTFKKANNNKWKHKKYKGWVTVSNTSENILFAKVQSKSKDDEQQIFNAFMGYLTRHCNDYIDTITIYYR